MKILPDAKNSRLGLHRNDCFYTAKAHFLIIPNPCIHFGMIISFKKAYGLLNAYHEKSEIGMRSAAINSQTQWEIHRMESEERKRKELEDSVNESYRRAADVERKEKALRELEEMNRKLGN